MLLFSTGDIVSLNEMFTYDVKNQSEAGSGIADQSDGGSVVANRSENESCKILIEGDAGSGKSTVCDRMPYQWAHKKAGINGLHKYRLVFLIKACFIRSTDQSIYDYIKRELLPDCGNINEVIKRTDATVLFVVDGYDELGGNKKVVLDLLEAKICPRSTVVLTSRYGQISAVRYFDKAFMLIGLSQQDTNRMIGAFNRVNRGPDVKPLQLHKHTLGQLLSTPLFLWFYMFLDVDTFEKATSRTELFRAIVDGIINKAVHRSSRSKSNCLEALTRLKSMAFQCMHLDKMYFTEQLDESIVNLGFLKKSTSRQGIGQQTVYTFTHKSILEYLTAQHIIENSRNCYELLQKLPEIQNQKRRQATMLLYFICGLSKNVETLQLVFKNYIPCPSRNRAVDVKHLLVTLQKYVNDMLPYFVETDHTEMIGYLEDTVQPLIDGSKSVQATNDVAIRSLLNIKTILQKHRADIFPEENESGEGDDDQNDHVQNHQGVQCAAEVENPHHLVPLGTFVPTDLKLNASWCSTYCVRGIKNTLECRRQVDVITRINQWLRHKEYKLRHLSVEYKDEMTSNPFSGNSDLQRLVRQAGRNTLEVVNNQNADLWIELSRCYRGMLIDVLRVWR